MISPMTITIPVVTSTFAGHAPHRVIGHNFIEHRIGDLITDLVRMAFCHGFGCKKVSCHQKISFHFSFLVLFGQNKEMPEKSEHLKKSLISGIFRRIWHLLLKESGCRASQSLFPPPLWIRWNIQFCKGYYSEQG